MSRSSGYAPRSPAQGVLYQVVRDHYETFRAQTDRVSDGAGLPRFVQDFGVDVLACPRCGDRFALIALVETREVIVRILTHLGLPTTLPAPRPARAPPLPFSGDPDPP